MHASLRVLLSLATFSLSAAGAETTKTAGWPQWRGPLASGEAPNAQPPTSWAEDRNIKWKVQVPGFGNSTPVIWGNRIYLATAITQAAAPSAETTSAPQAPAATAQPHAPANASPGSAPQAAGG